jgi:EmrB/QacA subfamily drug resistance transporter
VTAAALPVITSAPQVKTNHKAILATLSLAAFMASLDMFIVNVAFPAIGREFHGNLADVSWILNGYAVLYAALLVPLGRLADRYGRLNGFLAGLALFTIASAACAASQDLWSLVAFRGLQAVGAAALTPTSLGLLLAATPNERKVRAVRTWAAIGAVAAAIGPVAGGLLVQASWRWVFLVNIPVGVAALVIAKRVVPDSRDLAVSRTPDLAGAALATVGVGALALALVKGPTWGWSSAGVIAGFAAAAAAIAAFWWRSERHPLPVVEPALLRVRAFAWSNATAILFSVAFAGGLIAIVLWMQDVWGWSALRSGLALAPGPMMVPVFAAVSQRLTAKGATPAVLAATGCLMFGLGALILALSVHAEPSYAADVLPGWLIGGVGVGFALPTIMSAATADLPPARSSTGSAVVTMARQVGFVLGVSVFVALVGTPHGYSAAHRGFQDAWFTLVGVSVVAALAATRMNPRSGANAGRLA